MSTSNCFMNVINIGNSIIGVSILAMPYCFHKCGILLSMILIFLSGILTRIACYLLLKSAVMARRRNFEFLAFHALGSTGKLAVEMCIIGFLIGVCIAFFVVIGDLGPPLASEFLNIENSPNLRTNVLMLIGLCVALPLGMLRKIDSLTSFSVLSIAFYVCLILKIFAEAVPNLYTSEWWYQVNWWRAEGILPCLPIFSMALSCQTQVFEFFDTLNEPSLKRMQTVIHGAVLLCSSVYILIGSLGYIAFHDKLITGNILVLLTPSTVTEIIKLGFIVTVAVSFPLCLFPCRSSLHSLIFKQGFGHHDLNVTVIPETRFRILTVSLVIVTIGIAIMLPNIEFVLGIIGSTIGTLICLIIPAVIFIHDTSKETAEKRMAQVLMGVGLFILIACTFSTLQESSTRPKPISNHIQQVLKITPDPQLKKSSIALEIQSPISIPKDDLSNLAKEKEKEEENSPDQKRLEPPIPQDPDIKSQQSADLDPQAIQKEDKEIQKEMQPSPSSELKKDKNLQKSIDKQEKLLQKLEEQQEEQKLILEQQKKVLEELKLHKESHIEHEEENQLNKAKLLPTSKIDVLINKNAEEVVKKVVKEFTKKMKLINLKKEVPIVDTNYISKNMTIAKPLIEVNMNFQSDKPEIINEKLENKLEFNKLKVENRVALEGIAENKSVVEQKPNSINEGLKDNQAVKVNEEPLVMKVDLEKVEHPPQKIEKNADNYVNMREPLAEKLQAFQRPTPLTNEAVIRQNMFPNHEKLPT